MRRYVGGWARVVLGLALGVSSASAASISGTDHDFSGEGYGTDEICIFCHTPHNAKTTNAYAPLWNHGSSTATYTLYGGGQTSAGTPVGTPGAASKACLSCHDSTVAIDTYGSHAGSVHMSSLSRGFAVVGPNLADDHPVGVAHTAGTRYKTPTGTKLYDGKVECASCHDVHKNTFRPFLRMSRASSALCFDCHGM